MYLFIDAMIEQRSFKIKVDGKAKTIDTVVDTDQTQKILEGADPDVNENIFEPRTKNRLSWNFFQLTNRKIITVCLKFPFVRRRFVNSSFFI